MTEPKPPSPASSRPTESKPITREKFILPIIKGLIIASPHIERVLSGEKTWEIRSTPTKQRGRVALIRKGSGLVVGTGCTDKLSRTLMLEEQRRHRINADDITCGTVDNWNRGWMLQDARPLVTPIPYNHHRLAERQRATARGRRSAGLAEFIVDPGPRLPCAARRPGAWRCDAAATLAPDVISLR